MDFAAILFLGLMVVMLVLSPLRMVSPSALLAGSWGVIYALQSIFASDMYSSLLATVTIFTITASFAIGELIGCRAIGLKNNIQEHNEVLSTIIGDNCNQARSLKNLIAIFSLVIMIGVVMYADAMGMFRARSFDDLVLLPGVARVAMFSGELHISMFSRIGFLFAYSGAVLAMAYYYMYRWRWWLVLPIIEVLLLGMIQSGRAGTMIVLVQLMLTMYLKNVIVLKLSSGKILLRIFTPVVLMLIVFIGGQFLREDFYSTGISDIYRVMYSTRGYLFGGQSAFSYWINNIYNPKSLTLGKFSFVSIFSALGIAPEQNGVYLFYAPIAPNGDTSNLYTAYRSFIEDFSIPGACLVYLVAGVVIASITRGIVKGKRALILILIPLLSWLALSPAFSITYFTSFLLSCFFPYLLARRYSEA